MVCQEIFSSTEGIKFRPFELTGINLLLFCSYLFIARYKSRSPQLKPVFTTAVFMFLFSTIHVSLGFQRLIEGFIYLRDQPGGPGAFFSDVSIPANVAKVTIHTVNSILGDSIVVSSCPYVPVRLEVLTSSLARYGAVITSGARAGKFVFSPSF